MLHTKALDEFCSVCCGLDCTTTCLLQPEWNNHYMLFTKQAFPVVSADDDDISFMREVVLMVLLRKKLNGSAGDTKPILGNPFLLSKKVNLILKCYL